MFWSLVSIIFQLASKGKGGRKPAPAVKGRKGKKEVAKEEEEEQNVEEEKAEEEDKEAEKEAKKASIWSPISRCIERPH